MNLGNGCFMVCDRHPAQFFTGFCSACLAERLSNVNDVERSCKGFVGISAEDGDPSSLSDVDEKTQDGKTRKTLSTLFRLDDENKRGVDLERVAKEEGVSMVLEPPSAGFAKTHHEDDVRDCRPGLGSQVSQIFEAGIDGGSGGTKASSTCSTTVDISSAETCIERNVCLRGNEVIKQKGGTYWLGLALSRKTMKWMVPGLHRKSVDFTHGEDRDGNNVEKVSETKPKLRHSCDWSLFSNSTKTSWEDPRHSWDGSVVGRAFMCSFSCLDEMEETNIRAASETNGPKLYTCHESERNLHEEGMPGDLKPPFVPYETQKSEIENAGTSSSDHASLNRVVSKPLKVQFQEESRRDIVNHRSRKSVCQKWSKVWNWSISNPFRDSRIKREQVLDRSLSESWRDNHQVKAMENLESDAGSNVSGNGLGSSRSSTPFNRSRHFGSGDTQSARANGSNNRHGYNFGRSRSVHYSSPGNLENGLLRFYLTPLRSSRRNPHNGRTRTPRSLTRGNSGQKEVRETIFAARDYEGYLLYKYTVTYDILQIDAK